MHPFPVFLPQPVGNGKALRVKVTGVIKPAIRLRQQVQKLPGRFLQLSGGADQRVTQTAFPAQGREKHLVFQQLRLPGGAGRPLYLRQLGRSEQAEFPRLP